VAAVGLLDLVDGEATDGVDAEALEARFGRRHGAHDPMIALHPPLA
jgi:hypothetical protein